MKRILMILSLVTTVSTFALERKELMPLIEEASAKRESAYVEVRNKIIEYGTNAIPILGIVAVDETLSWQQQLVARICYERITRKEDVEKLLSTNWYEHPDFDANWNMLITGPEARMVEMIKTALKETGLWYYYLEQEWKMTGEKGNLREYAGYSFWASACSSVAKDSPEERIWFLRICSELMMEPSPRWDGWLYHILVREGKPDVSHVLEHRVPPPVTSEPPFRLGTNIIKRAKQP